jgi:enoyl-CoA hydratase
METPPPMTDAATEASVLARRMGRMGQIVLNRPRTLNALDLEMIRAIGRALDDWRDDPSVHLVTITGAGDRAFCAGGDIRAVRDAALARDRATIDAFFREEYALNAAIAAYPKPYVALIDGFCMGGGIGLSIHGQIRVASEAAQFAMPETAIGLFPDVGATFSLPRLPGHIGMYLGLTGVRLVGADAVHAGIATHLVPRAAFPDLVMKLAEDGAAALATHAIALPAFGLAAHREIIDRCFGAGSMDGVIAALATEDSTFTRETQAILARMSPSSMRWSFDIIRAGAGRTLRQCLDAEFDMVRRVTLHPDFAEGVRAMVVDKDRKPVWGPLSDPDGRVIGSI